MASPNWRADVARARADVQTATGLLAGVSVDARVKLCDLTEEEYLADAQRLTANAAAALDRALEDVRKRRAALAPFSAADRPRKTK